MNKKPIYFSILIILIVFGAIAILNYQKEIKPTTSTVSKQVKVVPLDPVEKQKVIDTVEASEFIKDVPSKGIISLRFYDFKDGERVWRDRILISKDQVVQSGEPDISVIIHSKYISELDNGLCEVISKAKANGDLAVETEKNKALLMTKYAGMLGYRDCFGF